MKLWKEVKPRLEAKAREEKTRNDKKRAVGNAKAEKELNV